MSIDSILATSTGFGYDELSPEHLELKSLAWDIVRGSTNLPFANRRRKEREILLHRFSIPSVEAIKDEVAAIYPVDTTTMWQIEPGRIRTTEAGRSPDGRRELFYQEFIGGIAVKNGIKPTDSDIASAIFFLGAEMQHLHMEGRYA